MKIFEIKPGLLQSEKLTASDAPEVVLKGVSIIIDMDCSMDPRLWDPFIKSYLQWHIYDQLELPNLDDLWRVAQYGYEAWNMGSVILTQCLAGKNRSSLVNGCILNLSGVPGEEAVNLIRQQNLEALSNQVYLNYLLSLKKGEKK